MADLTVRSAPAICAFRDALKARAEYARVLDAWLLAQANVPASERAAYLGRIQQICVEEDVVLSHDVILTVGGHPILKALLHEGVKDDEGTTPQGD